MVSIFIVIVNVISIFLTFGFGSSDPFTMFIWVFTFIPLLILSLSYLYYIVFGLMSMIFIKLSRNNLKPLYYIVIISLLIGFSLFFINT